MDNQMNFTDLEFAQRRHKTKKERFLEQMDKVVPWSAWIALIQPFYPDGRRGRKPQEIERMLRMLLLQTWFSLSDEGIEDALYDSYAMKTFIGINFDAGEQAPDATTLCKFRKLLNEHGLQKKMFRQLEDLLTEKGCMVQGGSIVDATIIEASSSKKNKEKQTDPEMHSTRKNTKWYFGMRAHIAVDPVHGYAHHVIVTPANTAEIKVAPKLLRDTDEVVYGDSGYLKMDRYDTSGIERQYRIVRQRGTFIRHYGKSIAYEIEKEIEKRKSSMRCKVEYVFHIVKDIFKWRRAKYKGISKNESHAHLLFASANLYMLASVKRSMG